MPKRKTDALNNSIAKSIFNELDLYAKDRQFYPIEGALYSYMIRPEKNESGKFKPRYDFNQDTFRYWFGRLVEDGYITIDKDTRSIRCNHLMIVEKDDGDL